MMDEREELLREFAELEALERAKAEAVQAATAAGELPGDEPISIREFARMVGTTDTTVNRFRKSGKMPKEAEVIIEGLPGRQGPKLIPSKAFPAWKRFNSTAKWNGTPGVPEKVIAAAVVAHAAQTATQPQDDQLDLFEETDAVKKQRADAKKAEVLTQLKEIELNEKLGKLVDRGKVYEALRMAGIEIRDNLLSIPGRIADLVFTAKDRESAEEIITKEIRQALESLSKLPETLKV